MFTWVSVYQKINWKAFFFFFLVYGDSKPIHTGALEFGGLTKSNHSFKSD